MTFITCFRGMFITWLNTKVGASVYSRISPLGVIRNLEGDRIDSVGSNALHNIITFVVTKSTLKPGHYC